MNPKGDIKLTENITDPIKISPHLYQLGVNVFPTYLSVGEKAMLIEGGTGGTAEIIVQQIKSLGIDPAKIERLVLPHTHPDHMGAVPRLKKIWPHLKVTASEIGAKTVAHEKYIESFLPTDNHISGFLKDLNAITEPPAELDAYDFSIDETIGEGDKIDLGDGVVWEVYATPGHCPDHLSLVEQKEGTMVIGDVTGYYDQNEKVFWPNYFGSLEEYTNSIRKMAAIPANRALLGHNGIIEGNPIEFFKSAMEATKTFHEELLKRTDAGEDKKELAKEKAKWVFSLAPLAPLGGISYLNNQLIKASQAERDKDLFAFPG